MNIILSILQKIPPIVILCFLLIYEENKFFRMILLLVIMLLVYNLIDINTIINWVGQLVQSLK